MVFLRIFPERVFGSRLTITDCLKQATAPISLRMMQKRFQGSHLANDEQASALNELIKLGKVDPCLSETFSFDEIGHVHQLMHENKHPYGNMACLVNATEIGTGKQ